MEKRKFSFILIILIGLCSSNLFAEDQSKAEKSTFEKSFNRAMEIIFPWPILSLETGRPEVFSFDIGLETLFIPVTYEARAGTYFAYGYARSKKDNFNRFSAGFALGMMGLFDAHAGVGLGLMPKNHETLHSWFVEVSYRMFLLEIKIITEHPIKPSGLVEYYKANYKDGYKFKIGISI
ncbi:MAG: hypothetical protein K5907_01660 [Treponema sp.]|nr:hypothetical protein [Treponema sp.]